MSTPEPTGEPEPTGAEAESPTPGARGPLRRIEADEENVQKGLVQLVLTLVELLRQVLEREAVRRMEAETLTEEQTERLGRTLMRLEEQMDELKETFDLTDADLDLDLGPLSRLM